MKKLVSLLLFILILMLLSFIAFAAGSGNDLGVKESVKLDDTGPDTVTLSFAGDVLLGGSVGWMIDRKGSNYIVSDVEKVLKPSDIAMVNLESPISSKGTAEKDKKYTFRARPQTVSELTYAGIDIVTLANNHILDYGIDAFRDTLKCLEDNKICYTGAGENIDRASSPVYIERKGCRIAFIASSHVIPFTSWYAGINKPGVASTYNPVRIRKEISEARKKADVVVYIHSKKRTV